MCFSRETNNFVGSAADTYYPLLTVRNDRIHSHGAVTEKANQSVVNLISTSGSHDDATPVGFFLLRNATLGGNPNFTRYAARSCSYIDTAATTATISSSDQLIFVFHTGQASGDAFSFADKILIQPGESITLAARAVTGTATYVNGSLNTREDQ
jgi:hypothetical protein